MTHGVDHNRGNENESEQASVKRNLNFNDAFKTQIVPDGKMNKFDMPSQ